MCVNLYTHIYEYMYKYTYYTHTYIYVYIYKHIDTAHQVRKVLFLHNEYEYFYTITIV